MLIAIQNIAYLTLKTTKHMFANMDTMFRLQRLQCCDMCYIPCRDPIIKLPDMRDGSISHGDWKNGFKKN